MKFALATALVVAAASAADKTDAEYLVIGEAEAKAKYDAASTEEKAAADELLEENPLKKAPALTCLGKQKEGKDCTADEKSAADAWLKAIGDSASSFAMFGAAALAAAALL